MDDRIRVFPGLFQFLESLGRREDHQLDASAFGFFGDVVHHGKRTICSASDDETLALPGDVLGQGQRGVAVLCAERLRGPLAALPDPSTIDHEVVLVGLPVDLDRSECEPFEMHVSGSVGIGASSRRRLESTIGETLMPHEIHDRGEIQSLLDRGAQLVEVLPPDEYEEEHLPGAINLPLRKLEKEAKQRLDPGKPVIVYCWDSA